MAGRLALAALGTLALAACDRGDAPIWAVGSSTVYPFTKAVADAFVKSADGAAAPKVESTGTEAGFAKFCESAQGTAPDIANASRQMRRAEFTRCQTNKVRDIVEVPIGLDGVALAESTAGPKLALTRKDLYLALAATPNGQPNAAKTWKDVNPALPAVPIQVFGPPAGSGTRDAFVDLMLQAGCLEANSAAQAARGSDPAVFDRTCRQIRADGAYVVEGEDDTVIVAALAKAPTALGLLGYSYLKENASRLRGVPIDGATPDDATISAGKYPGSRTLYIYTKKQQLEAKPQLRQFLTLYHQLSAPNGELAKHGLIAMSDRARARAKDAIDNARTLEAAALLQ